MGPHRHRDHLHARPPTGHRVIDNISQDLVGFGGGVDHVPHQTLRMWRGSALGYQQQPHNGQHERDVAAIQEGSRLRAGHYGDILEPVVAKVFGSDGNENSNQHNLQCVTTPLLGHHGRPDASTSTTQLTLRGHVWASTRQHCCDRQQGWSISQHGHRHYKHIHWRDAVLDGLQRTVVDALPNGSRLPWFTNNIDTIKVH